MALKDRKGEIWHIKCQQMQLAVFLLIDGQIMIARANTLMSTTTVKKYIYIIQIMTTVPCDNKTQH